MKFSKLLAVGTTAIAFAGMANAQAGIPAGAPAPGTGLFPASLGVSGASTTSYDHHWASMSGAPTVLWSGKGLFDFFGGPNNFAGFGDAIRICYGIDTTQGGRNWSAGGSVPGPHGSGINVNATGGATENTWFRIAQGFAPQAVGTASAGVDIGVITVMSGSTSALGGDNCFTPFVKGFSHAADSGGHKIGATALGGLFSATGIAAAPVFWEFSFAWGDSAVLVPNVIGDDSADPGIPTLGGGIPSRGTGLPLLANVIFEVQGPLNGAAGGFLTNQYYLSSTLDWAGIGGISEPGSGGAGATVNNITFDPVSGLRGTGGVTNGNANMAFDLFGVDAGATNAVSASRVFTNGPTGAFLNENLNILTPLQQNNPLGANFRAGRNEFVGQLAFQTPRLWAYHNFDGASAGLASSVSTSTVGAGHDPFGAVPKGGAVTFEGLDGNNGYQLFTGNGGPDWHLSRAPLSRVDIVSIDHETGADVNNALYAKVGSYTTPAGTTTPATFTGTPFAGGPAAAFDTSLGVLGVTSTFFIFPCYFNTFNRMFMVWSITPNAPQIQLPGSWSDFAGLGFALQGSPFTETLFAFDPKRDGNGAGTGTPWALTSDAITTSFSGKAALAFGTAYSNSDDFFADGAIDYGGAIFPTFSSLFEGLFVPQTSGQSDLKPDGGQLAPKPDASFAGQIFYLHSFGSHFDICTMGAGFELTEGSNALTITLQ